jgi:ATP-dependent DNA ligase
MPRRRKLLESLFAAPDDPPSRITVGAGTVGEVLDAVRNFRLEGLIGKRIDSTYDPG